jgi:hypothetical protein
MIKTFALSLSFLLAGAAYAAAQSPAPPYAYPRTVGTSSAQVLAGNNARRRVLFSNPNATAIIAVCPTISRVDSSAIACTVHGAGSITILPYASIQLDGIGGAPGPVASVPTSWNAISDTPGSMISIYEWE